ncbi:MSP (Major sperm protein) domain-containing protein [Ditylenchus destructor]|nr:MSP (Major sperm protein) domain-containing protein [Ditylenchus destructor]
MSLLQTVMEFLTILSLTSPALLQCTRNSQKKRKGSSTLVRLSGESKPNNAATTVNPSRTLVEKNSCLGSKTFRINKECSTQDDTSSNYDEGFRLLTVPDRMVEIKGDLMNRVKLMLKIINETDTRQVYKIRCTCNEAIKIYPAIGFVEPDTTVLVTIIYRCYQSKLPEFKTRHHLTVYHIPAPEDSYPEGVWQEHYGPAQGVKKIPLVFIHQAARKEDVDGFGADDTTKYHYFNFKEKNNTNRVILEENQTTVDIFSAISANSNSTLLDSEHSGDKSR